MLEQSIRDAVTAAPADPRDQPVVELALTYARLIDHAPARGRRIAAVTAGPKLLATMEALLMSPRARRTAAKEVVADDKPAPNPLDQLAERRAGKGRAAPVHSAATGSEQP